MPVYVHWSVEVIACIMLLGAIRRPLLAFTALVSYLAVVLIHECGHMAVARRKGCAVLSIALGPLGGACVCEMPWSRVDRASIAWGGALAQFAVAAPIIVWHSKFGYTSFEPANAIIAILGYFSVCVAVFNLIPMPQLDGATAWDVIPAMIERARSRRRRASWR